MTEDNVSEDSALEENESEETSVPAEDLGAQVDEANLSSMLPPPDFSSFVLSISTSVLMDLGEIEHPVNKKKTTNLSMAKHSIDMLAMFKEKTEGNLTDEENSLISNILADLRLRYCKQTG